MASIQGSRLSLPAWSVWPGASQVPLPDFSSPLCKEDAGMIVTQLMWDRTGLEIQPDPPAQVSKALVGQVEFLWALKRTSSHGGKRCIEDSEEERTF